MHINGLLEKAKLAARRAGEAILDVYHSADFAITSKNDQSPLTRADKAAHSVISGFLEETGLPLLSEEGAQIPYEERMEWTWFWLVDPLDGTKEFIKRNGEFTVNIALVNGAVPVAGVIYAPCLDVLFFGSQETGVYKVEGSKEITLPWVTKRKTLNDLQQQETITVVASKSHLNEETQAFIDQFRNVQLTSMGSSFKLMLLAEGLAEIYPRLAPTMEWDTAAGHALLRSLNRGVYQADLKTELQYNKASLLNPSFIAL